MRQHPFDPLFKPYPAVLVIALAAVPLISFALRIELFPKLAMFVRGKFREACVLRLLDHLSRKKPRSVNFLEDDLSDLLRCFASGVHELDGGIGSTGALCRDRDESNLQSICGIVEIFVLEFLLECFNARREMWRQVGCLFQYRSLVGTETYELQCDW